MSVLQRALGPNLQLVNVCCSWSLWPLLYRKLDALPLHQCAMALPIDRRIVDKNIIAPSIQGDKAKPFLVIKPLNDTGLSFIHFCFLLLKHHLHHLFVTELLGPRTKKIPPQLTQSGGTSLKPLSPCQNRQWEAWRRQQRDNSIGMMVVRALGRSPRAYRKVCQKSSAKILILPGIVRGSYVNLGRILKMMNERGEPLSPIYRLLPNAPRRCLELTGETMS